MEIVLLSDVYTEGWMRSAGAYKLATELRLAGYSVQVIDFTCRLTEKEASKLDAERTKLKTFQSGPLAIYKDGKMSCSEYTSAT